MENIYFLILHNEIEKIKLLDLTKKIGITNYFGQTPFIFACDEGRKEIVKIFIDAGSDINHVDKLGNTGLYYAEQKGYIGIMTIIKLALKN